jgi:hypothetical protein
MKRNRLLGLIAVLTIGLFVFLPGFLPQKSPVGASGTNPSKKAEQSFLRDRLSMVNAAIAQMKVGIEFYGVVVDDSENPVPNAQVRYEIRSPGLSMGIVSDDVKKGTTTTDANGNFEVHGSGARLSFVSIKKDDLRMSEGDTLEFGFSGTPEVHKPDKAHRVKFTLLSINSYPRVKQIFDRGLKFPWDGVPFRVDLTTGERSDHGELIVTAIRTEVERNRYNWSVTLSIEGGEVADGTLINHAIAPKDGYSSSWRREATADVEPPWLGRKPVVFYKRNGLYGRLDLNIHEDSRENEPSIYLKNNVNTRGERLFKLR